MTHGVKNLQPKTQHDPRTRNMLRDTRASCDQPSDTLKEKRNHSNVYTGAERLWNIIQQIYKLLSHDASGDLNSITISNYNLVAFIWRV